MADPTTTGDYSDVVSRRKFVSLAGATGAAAIAGCMDGGDGGGGDDGNGSDMDDGTGGGKLPASTNAWFDTTQSGHSVSDFQYNPNKWAGNHHMEYSLWAQYTMYNWRTGEFSPHLIKDWNIGSSEATFTLREDFTWSDGDDLTADDLLTQWRVRELSNHSLFDFANEVTAPSDYQIKITYDEGTNKNIIRHAFLHSKADMPPQDWEDFGESDNVANYNVSEPTASGPIQLDEKTENYHQFTPREDHPFGENFNWKGYRMRNHSSNQAMHQAFISQEIDGVHSLFASGTTLNRFPDSIEEITFPGVFGLAMWFNHNRQPWDDRKVRQAVHHSLDLQPILRSLGQRKKIYHETQTGLTDVAVQEWFGGYDIDGFNQYPQDTDTANQLVNEADESIGDIQPTFVVPAGWSDWVSMASLIANQMGQAGWDVSLNTLGGSYYDARSSGDFDMVAGPHKNTSQHNAAYFGLRFQLYGESGSPADFSNYASADGNKTVTIDGEDINIKDTFESLASTQDEATQTELITKLAKIVNRDVPYVHVAQKYEQSFIDRSKWAFPDEDPLMYSQWPMNNLVKTTSSLSNWDTESPGLLKSKGSSE